MFSSTFWAMWRSFDAEKVSENLNKDAGERARVTWNEETKIRTVTVHPHMWQNKNNEQALMASDLQAKSASWKQIYVQLEQSIYYLERTSTE